MRTRLACLILILMTSCGGPRSSVRIALPLPPKLDLSDYEFVFFPGFISETQVDSFDPDLEAVNFFKREFTRRDVMPTIEVAPADFSGKETRKFFVKEQPFFKDYQFEHADNTLAVTGSLTFEVLDRSGFRQVETTDITGRSYYRTQFVEITGFDLTMKVFVYNMEGQLLYTESLKDSIDVEAESTDERLVFYELLQRISDRVLGLFTNTVVKAERSLL